MAGNIKVIIVDDSAFIREMLSTILSKDPDINVVAMAEDPYDARKKIKQHNPDVITLDIEMPKMDGIEFLTKIMRLRPTPVVMISTLTQAKAEMTLRALEIGAIDCIGKPHNFHDESAMLALSDEIIQKVKQAAQANVHVLGEQSIEQVESHDPSIPAKIELIAIGASTGGVEALHEILAALPAHLPPIVIVQHMPACFTPSFAERLNQVAQNINIKELVNNERLKPGHAYIAPGDQHMEIVASQSGLIGALSQAEKVSGHRPSVDVMFNSIVALNNIRAVGVILTGMGRDGASGLQSMQQAGHRTVGQNETSCVVYGMPRVAFELGAVEKQVSLANIAATIVSCCYS